MRGCRKCRSRWLVAKFILAISFSFYHSPCPAVALSRGSIRHTPRLFMPRRRNSEAVRHRVARALIVPVLECLRILQRGVDDKHCCHSPGPGGARAGLARGW